MRKVATIFASWLGLSTENKVSQEKKNEKRPPLSSLVECVS